MTPPTAILAAPETEVEPEPILAPVPAEPHDGSVATISLADAIRRGAALSEPLRRGYLAEDPEGTKYSCALGAAYLGAKSFGLIDEG